MSDASSQSGQRPYAREAEEVLNLAVALAHGKQTEEEFTSALLTLDAQELQPKGLTLALSRTADGWTSVLVKHTRTGQICTAFEFLPATRQFRPFSQINTYQPEALPAAWRGEGVYAA
jgi:hypothetical protein